MRFGLSLAAPPGTRGPGAGPERCLCAPLSAGWLPALQLVRHGSKAVTRHWKAMHFQRQKLMAVTEYLAPRPAIPPRCLAPRKEKVEEVIFWRVAVVGVRL